jgi:hypothetical protein
MRPRAWRSWNEAEDGPRAVPSGDRAAQNQRREGQACLFGLATTIVSASGRRGLGQPRRTGGGGLEIVSLLPRPPSENDDRRLRAEEQAAWALVEAGNGKWAC